LLTAAGHRLLQLQNLPPSTSHQEAAAWIADRAQDGDRVVALGIRRLVTEHYLRLAESDIEIVSFPPSTDKHPGWSDDEALLQDEAALITAGREQAAAFAVDIPANGRLFVLARRFEHTWRVDRHLINALIATGWQRLESNDELVVTTLQRPTL
jgi:hypothetical protein